MISRLPPPAASQMGKDGLGTYEVRAHVDRPAAVELRDGGVADRTVDLDADVGPRGIEAAEGLHRLLEAVRKRRRVTGVDSDRDRIGLGCDLGKRLGCDVEERQVPPGRVQRAGAGGADTRGSADDHDPFVAGGGRYHAHWTRFARGLEASLPQACAVDTRPGYCPGLDIGGDTWQIAPVPDSLLVLQNDLDKPLGRIADGLARIGIPVDVRLAPTRSPGRSRVRRARGAAWPR